MRGAYIIKNDHDNKLIESVKEELLACPFFNSDYGEVIKYPIFREKTKYLCLPRFYKNKKLTIKRKFTTGDEADTKFTQNLRPKQIEIANDCLEKIKNVSGGIINLPCGYGKTVIALYLAAKLKIKTLVIVHKTFLQDQWIERAKQFTDAKIGTIRQNKIDTENKDIVIGMLQSISMKDYDANLFDQFGLVIYDEAHHIISKVFSNALFKINPQYIIGLSATPYRSGNLTKGLMLHLGKMIYKIDKKEDEKAIVKVFHYKTIHKLFEEKKIWMKGKVAPNSQKMINNICELECRNRILVDIIYNMWKIEDRKILVLSGRTSKIEHLKMLKELLQNKIKEEIKEGKLLNDECRLHYYTGKTSQLERSEAEKHADIIFATYEMAHEGLDIPRLNTMIMTTPKTNVQQAVGRIMRNASSDVFITPLIIDVVDELSTFPKQYEKREKLYKKLNYQIESYHLDTDHLITKRQYLKKKYNCTDEELVNEFNDKNPDYEPDLEKILSTTTDI